jgi:hypothetical protein
MIAFTNQGQKLCIEDIISLCVEQIKRMQIRMWSIDFAPHSARRRTGGALNKIVPPPVNTGKKLLIAMPYKAGSFILKSVGIQLESEKGNFLILGIWGFHSNL